MQQEKLLWLAVLRQTLTDFAAGDSKALEWLHTEFALEAVEHPLKLKRLALELGPKRVGELLDELMAPQSAYEYRDKKISLEKWSDRSGEDWLRRRGWR